ncbi:MAG: OmpA family protein [Bacteroidota bacterium]|nr:OmpA family protein [Bacteroidota bacterium]
MNRSASFRNNHLLFSAILFILLLVANGGFSQSKSFEFYYSSGKKTPNNLFAFKDSLKKWDKDYNIQLASVQGYADSIGSERSNLLLSKKRANAADSILRSLGIQTKQVEVKGNGERNPAYTNSTKSGRAKNRKVLVSLMLISKYQAVVLTIGSSLDTANKKGGCEERDTVFILPEGTEIEIKACCLEGMKLSDIQVEADEVFTKDKMILNKYYTQTTEGNCLSTGGMLKLNIKNKSGEPVKIKKGCDITIRIPQLSQDTAFDLYEMQKSKQGENTGWQKRDEKVTYLKNRRMFEVKLSSPAANINLDFLPKPFAGLVKNKRPFLKTRYVRKGKAYLSGNSSVLDLKRFRPKKFNLKDCDCTSSPDEFVTVVASKKGKIYYAHKRRSELKQVSYIRHRTIVRKKDYVKFATKKQLEEQLRKDFGLK